jgi:UDP-glucose 4-epimerase
MRILVTGGFGYIGGRLVGSLADDPDTAVTAGGRAQRRAPAGSDSVVIDWSDKDSIIRACGNQDVIVHLAAMNEPDCERDPDAALRCNGQYTAELLRAAEYCGVRRIVYVSTSKVFGNNPDGTIDETGLPRPASYYAITHRLAEDYILAAHDKSQIEGVVLRLSNAVGASADPDVDAWSLIANDLCRQAAVDTRIVLRSSGLAWRNFIAMADVVSALSHALAMPAAKLGNGLFHLGSSQSMRIVDLAGQIADRAERLHNRRVKIQRAAPRADEAHVRLDWCIGKFAATGWSASKTLDLEIDRTLQLCRDQARARP